MGKRLDLKQFIEICKLKHDGKYDYSKIKEYINNKTYYTIRCIEHDYTFDIRGDMHLQGQGCGKCKKNKLSNLRKNSLDDVILLFRKKHGDKYDYSLIKESKIKSQKEYYLSYKDINTNLPSHPHKIYKKDWINWSNYLSIEKQTLERDNMGRFKKKV